MIKPYRYKIKPTVKLLKILSSFFGSVRFIYNWGLSKKINEYKNNNLFLSYPDLCKELTKLKHSKGYEWLNDCSNECLLQSLRHLDKAYQSFFKSKSGFPKFKSKKHSKDTCSFTASVKFDFINNKINVAKIGWIKFCPNQIFDINRVRIGTLTITKDKCNEFWCSVCIDDKEECKPKAKVCFETSIGIDLGIKHYAILSNGVKYDNPKFFERNLKTLKRLQRKFARSQNNSKRHECLRVKIAKLHRHIANKKLDFIHKLSKCIVNSYDTICMESLSVKNMMNNKDIAKSIWSASWYEFKEKVSYKCKLYGKNFISIGKYDPSSLICSCCGYRNANTKNLNIRYWICLNCGHKHDRDVNAAINIRNIGLQKISNIE